MKTLRKRLIFTLILIALALTLISGMSFRAFADEPIFEGHYLVNPTSLATDGSRLYLADNHTGSAFVQSYIYIFDFDGGKVSLNNSVSMTGHIKRTRYTSSHLFTHIGDSLYLSTLDSFGNETDRYTVLTDTNLITFDVTDNHLFVLHRIPSSNSYGVARTDISSYIDFYDNGGDLRPDPLATNIQVYEGIVDITASHDYLYILMSSGNVMRHTVSTSSVYPYTQFAEGSNPTHLVVFGNYTAAVNGSNIWVLPDNALTAPITKTSVTYGETPVTVTDAVAIGERVYILDTSKSNGKNDVKTFTASGYPVSLTYVGILLGNNAVMAELPNFSLNAYTDAILSGTYELAYATAHPSSSVYTLSDVDKSICLEGITLTPSDLFLILNYNTESNFYLIMLNGKLGYIEKNAATVSIQHARFTTVTNPARVSLNQTLQIYSLPSTAASNYFVITAYNLGLTEKVAVDVLYELTDYDCESGVKWVYVSYYDEAKLLRYGFALNGDLRKVTENQSVYTLMRANPPYGVRINVYQSNTVTSKVLTTVASGTDIKVYEAFETMSYVGVDTDSRTVYGYVYNSQLIEEGEMTVNEGITMLFIFCALVVISIAVSLILVLKRRNNVKKPVE